MFIACSRDVCLCERPLACSYTTMSSNRRPVPKSSDSRLTTVPLLSSHIPPCPTTHSRLVSQDSIKPRARKLKLARSVDSTAHYAESDTVPNVAPLVARSISLGETVAHDLQAAMFPEGSLQAAPLCGGETDQVNSYWDALESLSAIFHVDMQYYVLQDWNEKEEMLHV